MSGIYIAETSYISEFGICESDLLKIGFSVVGNIRYNAGFTGNLRINSPLSYTLLGGTNSSLEVICTGMGTGTDSRCKFIEAPTNLIEANFTGPYLDMVTDAKQNGSFCFVNDNTFRATAARVVSGNVTNFLLLLIAAAFRGSDPPETIIDYWYIDQNKLMKNSKRDY